MADLQVRPGEDLPATGKKLDVAQPFGVAGGRDALRVRSGLRSGGMQACVSGGPGPHYVRTDIFTGPDGLRYGSLLS
jgi:hypothetical protein